MGQLRDNVLMSRSSMVSLVVHTDFGLLWILVICVICGLPIRLIREEND
mgnify:CR=1 FL=1